MPEKNILWIALSIFLIVNISCTKRPPAKLHKNLEGFGDIKWGQEISALEDMVCIKNKHPRQKVCTRKDELLKMGRASLDTVEYYFWNDKFYSVVVTIKGQDNFERLKKNFFAEILFRIERLSCCYV